MSKKQRSFRARTRIFTRRYPLDLTATLVQLESLRLDEPSFNSNLVRRCHALHSTPLGEFTPSDLRLMLGQHISPHYLVPLALTHVANDALLDTTFYAGDLLVAVLKQEPMFWATHPLLRQQVQHLLASLLEDPTVVTDPRVDAYVTQFCQQIAQ